MCIIEIPLQRREEKSLKQQSIESNHEIFSLFVCLLFCFFS